MTSVEKKFRKLYKEVYLDFRFALNLKGDYESKKSCIDRATSKLIMYEELAGILFPNINVERCENRWSSEWKKEHPFFSNNEE